MALIQEVVRQFVLDNLLFGQEEPTLTDKASFVELGILDSSGVIELVSFLEETYKFHIEDEELIPANLDSIEAVCRFIETKRTVSVCKSEQDHHAG